MSPNPPHFLIIDGHSLVFRCYYGFPATLTLPNGQPIHAVYGFITLLFKAIEDFNPEHLCICFDRKEPTFRHILYEAYKAHRPPAPEDLFVQVTLLKELLEKLKIPVLEVPGFEADDLMGTLSLEAKKHHLHTLLMTSDQDALQLVDDTTSVVMNSKSSLPWVRFTPEEVQKKYQFSPIQMIDYKALRGDTSDNIPGVPGIGEKTATALITQFSNLDTVYAHLDQVASASVRAKLESGKEKAFLSKELATIHRETPLPIPIEKLTFQPNWVEIVPVFEAYQFKSLARKYAAKAPQQLGLFGDAATPSKPVAEKKNSRNINTHEELMPYLTLLQAGSGIYLDIALSSETAMQADIVKIGLFSDKMGHVLECDPMLLHSLKPLLENTAVPKTLHNAKHAELALKRVGIQLKGVIADTLLMGYLLNPGSELSLGTLLEKYFPEKIFSTPLASGQKTWALAELTPLLNMLIHTQKMDTLLRTIELPLAHVLAEIEYEGVCLDTGYLSHLQKEFSEQMHLAKIHIYELAGQEFNVNSPKQLSEILFDKLKLPEFKKTKTGRSTDASVLEKLAPNYPIANWILKNRSLEKLNSTYVQVLPTLLHPQTKRIHATFNQVVTMTGRLSSSDPNLQNIPIRTEEGLKIRKAFIPSSPDRLILSADYSQIELRILAHLSQDENMLRAFKNKEDIHESTAAIIHNIPITEVTKAQRSSAKAVNFGIIYGISSYGLSENLTIPVKDAKAIIENYFATFPRIQAFIDSTLEQTRASGEVATEFGRIRRIPDIRSSNFSLRQFAERTAVNTRIQGTAADIMKLAMIALQTELEKRQAPSKLIIQVHDELVLDVVSSELEKIKNLVQNTMENVVSWSIPLSVDLETGHTWAEIG